MSHILYYSKFSPFSRICRAYMRELGLDSQVEEVLAALRTPENPTLTHGPLGKVPALLTPEGILIQETPLVCDALAELAGGSDLHATSAKDREMFGVALGLCDSLSWQVRERRRPEEWRFAPFVGFEAGRSNKVLDYLEGEIGEVPASGALIPIALATACWTVEMVIGFEDWRSSRPALSAWFDEMAKRPSIAACLEDVDTARQ